jgi:hypothetical protein
MFQLADSSYENRDEITTMAGLTACEYWGGIGLASYRRASPGPPPLPNFHKCVQIL